LSASTGPVFQGKRPFRPDLKRPLAVTQDILASARRIASQLNAVSADQLTRRLRSLTAHLVSDLIPLLDAEARVAHDLVDAERRCDLESDHRQVRLLTERLEMITDNLERQRRRAPDRALVQRALREVVTALAALESHQRVAFVHLDKSLPPENKARLAKAFEEAAIAARTRTMLIDRPDVPPTASTVLRKRPDLDTAYPISLADLEGPPAPSRP